MPRKRTNGAAEAPERRLTLAELLESDDLEALEAATTLLAKRRRQVREEKPYPNPGQDPIVQQAAREQFRRLLRDGLSLEAIADRYGVSRQRASQVARAVLGRQEYDALMQARRGRRDA